MTIRGRLSLGIAKVRALAARPSGLGSEIPGGPDPTFEAAYEVLFDAPKRLGTAAGEDHDATIQFRLLQDVVKTGDVIISFLLIRADNLRLSVKLNKMGYTRDYAPGAQRSVHEVIGPALESGGNELSLRVDQGSCELSDLIVWYKVSH